MVAPLTAPSASAGEAPANTTAALKADADSSIPRRETEREVEARKEVVNVGVKAVDAAKRVKRTVYFIITGFIVGMNGKVC